jgi:peptidoglycan hydrolase-like protein with peptidoglycan-binding domain
MATDPQHRSGPALHKGLWIGIGAAALAVAVTASILIFGHGHPSASASSSPGVVPLEVLATSPANGSATVDPGSTITVDLSTALRSGGPMPTLAPSIPGVWSWLSPSELEFVSDGPLVPGTQETLTIPGGRSGLTGAQGQHLKTSVTDAFSVAQGSTLRLQQLLAELGYLPVNFTPASQPAAPQYEAEVQQGTFSWKWSDLPAQLTALWTPGTYNVITKGAVMNFENQHNLKTDGLAGPNVWGQLLAAAATGASNTIPWDDVYVQKTLPETVYVYENGQKVYQTLGNTGVPGDDTPDGTFPVYLRFLVTTMRGTNPDGTKYVDPGIPWVSYFTGSDALHGYVRAQYGFPQSDGCVEMPPAHAQMVFPLTPIGTLVTVQ